MSNFVRLLNGSVDIGTVNVENVQRLFREAWKLDADESAIEVDMDAAKDLWRNKIRRWRKKAFEKLDAEYMMALETGADTTAIVARKQALRDAPAHADITNATTPAELAAFQPIEDFTITR